MSEEVAVRWHVGWWSDHNGFTPTEHPEALRVIKFMRRRGDERVYALDDSALALVTDALEHMALTVPTRREEVVAAFKALGVWHNHDQEDEDEHCTDACPAWFPGARCSNCGVRHKARPALAARRKAAS